MDTSTNRRYIKRNIGDVVNGAVLTKRINGQRWEMKCPCGNTFISQPSDTNGLCWDCARKTAAAKITKHNESPRHKKNASRLYTIWSNMRVRCNTPSNKSYASYGGRGIRVCPEWSEYKNFRDWAIAHGYQENLSLDRINNNGNYEPLNCRWATQSEQMRNTRKNHLLEFNGQTKTIAEWAEITGIEYHTLKNRINRYGFSVEDALTTPVRKGNNQNTRRKNLPKVEDKTND